MENIVCSDVQVCTQRQKLQKIEETAEFAKMKVNVNIGVRAGGARVAAAPPQFGQLRFFLGSKRKFGQSLFLKTSSCLFNYFEDLNINLKSA